MLWAPPLPDLRPVRPADVGFGPRHDPGAAHRAGAGHPGAEILASGDRLERSVFIIRFHGEAERMAHARPVRGMVGAGLPSTA
jgi:hypothetical protein